MEAVERGEVDVGFMLSGWLEANFPNKIPEFRLLAPKSLAYQREPYPFLTSTQLVPAYGLSSSPDNPWMLQQQVRARPPSIYRDIVTAAAGARCVPYCNLRARQSPRAIGRQRPAAAPERAAGVSKSPIHCGGGGGGCGGGGGTLRGLLRRPAGAPAGDNPGLLLRCYRCGETWNS